MKPFLAAGLVLALSGCTSLEAVRGISTKLFSASTTWNDVGGDIYGSCERESSINPDIANCDLEKSASEGIAAANTVLASYFKALSDAANESNFTVQPGLDQAAASVAKIPDINADQVKAVSGLFGLLAKVATETMREATLRDLIGQGGPAAQTLIRGMNSLVVPRLARELDAERVQLTGKFGLMILAQKDSVGSDPAALCRGAMASTFSGAGYLLTIEYCRRLAVVDTRVKALADYQASLGAADKAMVELQSSKSRLKARDLAQKLYVIGTDLDDKIITVKKSFS